MWWSKMSGREREERRIRDEESMIREKKRKCERKRRRGKKKCWLLRMCLGEDEPEKVKRGREKEE
jgi:hypothetical protein